MCFNGGIRKIFSLFFLCVLEKASSLEVYINLKLYMSVTLLLLTAINCYAVAVLCG